MKSINLAVTLLLPSSVIGFGVINSSSIQSLHEATTTSLPQISSIFHHSTAIVPDVDIYSNLNLLDLYKQTLVEHPLPTKMMTGGTLAVCGDAIAQSRSGERYDKRRGVSFAAFDCVYRAVQHFSFPVIVQQCQGQYIGALVMATPGMNSLVHNLGWENPDYYYGAMEQTLSSQLGIVPFFYYPVFYTITAFVQGLDQEAAVQRAKDTFVPLMKRNLLFWIPVQFVQFGYIDENLQIPFLSVAGLAWTFIISVFAGNAKQTTPPQEIDEELIVVMRDDNTVVGIAGGDVKDVEEADVNVVEKGMMKERETVLR